jgi:Fur family peroxide stress response transcriptional regulator
MALAPLDHDALRAALEAAGLRCTPQRLAVYDQLSRELCHPTAEDVFHAVRLTIPKISLATVYKALETLVDIGAATKLTAADGTGSARYDARSEAHYHFRCLRTGIVYDLPTRFDPALVSKLDPHLEEDLDRQGFRVTGYRLELIGYRDQSNLAAHSRLQTEASSGPAIRPFLVDGNENQE